MRPLDDRVEIVIGIRCILIASPRRLNWARRRFCKPIVPNVIQPHGPRGPRTCAPMDDVAPARPGENVRGQGRIIDMTATKTRVAILGGGIGALSAAFALSEIDPRGERYEITLYQLGWRLGGKTASGRNAKQGQRIEEHGLHIWAGFYENAFTILRAALKALDAPPSDPIRTIDDAFKRQNEIFYAEYTDGQWLPWPFWFQPDVDEIGLSRPGQPVGARRQHRAAALDPAAADHRQHHLQPELLSRGLAGRPECRAGEGDRCNARRAAGPAGGHLAQWQGPSAAAAGPPRRRAAAR
ncbi:NAD(P)-binding protein [Bradyrhizobium oligotrophicum S58]